MNWPFRHWVVAAGLALIAHLGIAYLIFAPTDLTPLPVGKSVLISLGTSGGAPGQGTAEAGGEKSAAPSMEPAQEPETVRTTPITDVPTSTPPKPAIPPIAMTAPPAVEQDKPEPAPKPEPKPKSEPKPNPEPKSKSAPNPQPIAKPRSSPQALPKTTTASTNRQRASARTPSQGPGRSDVKPGVGTSGNRGHGADRAAAPMSGNPRPSYPRLARRRGHQGRVIIRALVSSSGHVTQATVKQSSGYDSLDKAALKSVKRWRFRPAQRRGEPVSATLDVPIVFQLEKG